MRVPLSLSLSLLFLAVSSCFSSGSETDRFEEKKRAIKETQPPQTHKLAEQKTSSSRIRFIIIIIVVIIIIIIIIIIVTAVPVFHFLYKISSLLACFTHCIFWLFPVKPLQKKNLVRRECVSLIAPSELPFTRRIGLLLNKRKTRARVLFARARVYI